MAKEWFPRGRKGNLRNNYNNHIQMKFKDLEHIRTGKRIYNRAKTSKGSNPHCINYIKKILAAKRRFYGA